MNQIRTYSENTKQIDAIDRFVDLNGSKIGKIIWDKAIDITPENIFLCMVEFVNSTLFEIQPKLITLFWKSLYFGIVSSMALDPQKYIFPMEVYINSLTE
jgi:hypothetical protein